MKSYIKLSKNNEIIQVLDYRDERYELIINSIDLSGFIQVELADEQIDCIANRTRRLSLIDGQVIDYQPTNEELAAKLLAVKKEKIEQVVTYDSSDAVNNFYISDMPMWLDKATRTSLAYTIDLEAEAGKENVKLWSDTIPPTSFDIPIAAMKKMLFDLELYAKETYDVTQQHKAAVWKLDNITEVEGYDYKIGYPEKLTFEINRQ